MNYFDIILLCVILISLAAGLRSGVIKQVFSIAAITGGVVLGFFFHEPLGAVLVEKSIIAEPKIADILGFMLAASVAYILIHYLSRSLTQLLEKINMGWLNHLLGGATGFIIGLLICYLIIIGVRQFFDEDAPFIKNSILTPSVIKGYEIIREQGTENLDESLEKLRELREEKRKSGFE
ncbi:MAG: CvpA family protein [Candidatus Dadabacteria bacterium]|nr:CvpA family protein [Candidatus Dadabacteria bacterium]MCY4262397.1 CvpA family protein [Candidatus Dadabacteria bacterium]